MAIECDATFIAQIRSDVGDPRTVDMIDGDVTSYFNDCINDLNENLRNYVYRTLTTVADQQEYAVNANTKRVIDVWREIPLAAIASGNAVSEINVGGLTHSLMGELGSGDGVSFFNYPSLFEIWSRKLKAWRKVTSKTWEFVGGTIWLIPPPGTTGDYVMYVSDELFTGASLPDRWTFIKDYVRAKCFRKLAAKRWNTGGVQGAGGIIQYSPQRDLIMQAEQLEKQYKTARENIAMTYMSVIE